MTPGPAPGGGAPPRATIHLVRHAKAESRRHFTGDDRRRPLTPAGERQAEAIAQRLVAARPAVRAVLSSEAARCLGTVAPLATMLGQPVRVVPSLLEGSDPLDALTHLLDEAAAVGVLVACSHGDVVLGLMEKVASDLGLSDDPAAPKASTWELAVEGGEVVGAALVPPPAG